MHTRTHTEKNKYHTVNFFNQLLHFLLGLDETSICDWKESTVLSQNFKRSCKLWLSSMVKKCDKRKAKGTRNWAQLIQKHILQITQHKTILQIVQYYTALYSLLVRVPDSWSKGCEFQSRQEWRENFLLQSQLCVLTLSWCPFHPPCYHSGM